MDKLKCPFTQDGKCHTNCALIMQLYDTPVCGLALILDKIAKEWSYKDLLNTDFKGVK